LYWYLLSLGFSQHSSLSTKHVLSRQDWVCHPSGAKAGWREAAALWGRVLGGTRGCYMVLGGAWPNQQGVRPLPLPLSPPPGLYLFLHAWQLGTPSSPIPSQRMGFCDWNWLPPSCPARI
jgi:hypothetical protein